MSKSSAVVRSAPMSLRLLSKQTLFTIAHGQYTSHVYTCCKAMSEKKPLLSIPPLGMHEAAMGHEEDVILPPFQGRLVVLKDTVLGMQHTTSTPHPKGVWCAARCCSGSVGYLPGCVQQLGHTVHPEHCPLL